MKSRTIIVDYNFLTTAHLRKIFNKETCDFHKFIKNLSFYFEIKIYSKQKKDVVLQYLNEKGLINDISAIISKKESCLLFLNLDSMNSIDYLIKAYYENPIELINFR